ncbi:MAG: hypothetical protein AAFX39_11375 [Pseudomonadota bacterium]
MDHDRFDQLIDLHGGDVKRWPDDERMAAEALLTMDSAARARLDQAQAFDALLTDAVSVPGAPLGLATRIQAAAREDVVLPGWMSGLRLLLGGGAASAVASAAGFFVMSAFLTATETGSLLDVANGSYMTSLMAL